MEEELKKGRKCRGTDRRRTETGRGDFPMKRTKGNGIFGILQICRVIKGNKLEYTLKQ